jgi:hypothetical protein
MSNIIKFKPRHSLDYYKKELITYIATQLQIDPIIIIHNTEALKPGNDL